MGKHKPERMCVGCREKKQQSELLRISFKDGKATVDILGKSEGRGAYLCRDEKCLEIAKKKKILKKHFKADIPDEIYEHIKEIL